MGGGAQNYRCAPVPETAPRWTPQSSLRPVEPVGTHPNTMRRCYGAGHISRHKEAQDHKSGPRAKLHCDIAGAAIARCVHKRQHTAAARRLRDGRHHGDRQGRHGACSGGDAAREILRAERTKSLTAMSTGALKEGTEGPHDIINSSKPFGCP